MAGQETPKPAEQEAVRTTIIGGRPPGSGKPLGPIPRGIEVLVKKASVDTAFRALLLEKRSEAAKEIDLALEPSESMMLNAVPEAQLQTIIERTPVDPKHRAAFLGKVAAVMLLALGVGMAGCDRLEPTRGTQPDRSTSSDNMTKGIQPDRPPIAEPTEGIRPDRPPMSVDGGIRPTDAKEKIDEGR
jgi:hypothetical protein